jgi:hypothetical protein
LWRLGHPKLQGIGYRYEKAGLTVADEPIPWNAETVLVEASVWLPPGIRVHKGDFQLRTPDRVPRMAVSLQPDGEEGAVRVLFRLPPVPGQTLAIVSYQGTVLGQVVLPYLSAEGFVRDLRLRAPMVFALLGKFNVACQTLAEDQCCGLSASAVLTSRTSLLPILDSDL